MSVALMTMVWKLKLPASEKMVLLYLCDRANDHGGDCWPAVSSICEAVSKGERCVQAALASLEAHGFFAKKLRGSTSPQYTLNIGLLSEFTPAKNAPRKKCTPQKMHPRPAKSAGKTRNICAQTIIEPSINHQRETSNEVLSVSVPESLTGELQALVQSWNDLAGKTGLVKIQKLTEKRRRAAQARLRDDGLQAIQAALDKIPGSQFLLGQSGGWRASFDFILQPDSVTKILEGKYDDRENSNRQNHARAKGRLDPFGRLLGSDCGELADRGLVTIVDIRRDQRDQKPHCQPDSFQAPLQ